MGLRERADQTWNRSRLARELWAALIWPRTRDEAPDVAHLATYADTTTGPVQRDEALLLHGLVRVVRPRTVLEIGFQSGQSAFNFLCALDADARLYSYDIHPSCPATAERRFGHDPRFKLLAKSMTEMDASDLDGRPADLVFIDGPHDLALNQAMFARLLPLLSPDAILAVHDTGTVPRRLFPEWHWLLQTDENWLGDEYEGEPGERAFVNWILDEHPEFSQLHLHSREVVRCGITLLQRTSALPRPPRPNVTRAANLAS